MLRDLEQSERNQQTLSNLMGIQYKLELYNPQIQDYQKHILTQQYPQVTEQLTQYLHPFHQ